jgi:hypothetical protein
MSSTTQPLQTVLSIKYGRFDAIVQAVRTARTKDLAFMHAARLVECMEDLEDMATIHEPDSSAFTNAERTFEDVLRTTPLLKNKIGLLCPRLVQPIQGITIYRVIGADVPMPDSHNKIRGSRANKYLTCADDLRAVFSNASDEDFVPGLVDFLDTLNTNTPAERQMVLLELNGTDGTFLFGDLSGFNIFVRDSNVHPWMNYVHPTSLLRYGNTMCAAALLRDRMVASELFTHVREPLTGAAIFAPVGPRPGHWNSYVAECPAAPRRTRRRVEDDE